MKKFIKTNEYIKILSVFSFNKEKLKEDKNKYR